MDNGLKNADDLLRGIFSHMGNVGLKVLVYHAGSVVSPRHILQRAWGDDYGDEDDYVRTYITRLRKKLEADPGNPCLILSERGQGYRLVKGM